MAKLEYKKRAAKKLFKEYKLGNPFALLLVKNVIHDCDNITLMKCQHVIAKQNGYNNWKEMKDSMKD